MTITGLLVRLSIVYVMLLAISAFAIHVFAVKSSTSVWPEATAKKRKGHERKFIYLGRH
jgi:uncharacterized protein HemY